MRRAPNSAAATEPEPASHACSSGASDGDSEDSSDKEGSGTAAWTAGQVAALQVSFCLKKRQ